MQSCILYDRFGINKLYFQYHLESVTQSTMDTCNQAFIQGLLSTAFFFLEIQFFQCLFSSVAPQGGSMVDTEGEICLKFRSAYFSDFSGNFRVYTYMQVSFMLVCKFLNQRVRRMGEQNGKTFKGVSKTKKKKKHMKRMSEFHKSIQD